MTDASLTDPIYGELIAEFPQQVELETRSGFTGVIVDQSALVDVVTFLHDKKGYDYLANLTAVDDYPEDQLEVIYHLFRTTGGGIIELKVFTGREEPVVPSLYSIYLGADFQEREVWDMYGIKFSGHPDLRRLLLWEDFAGHPLRKDWKEPFLKRM